MKANVVANYIGQAWRALIGLAFVPLYIKYLGIEAYGLIGIFAVLQTCLALLDAGMRPALGREMARSAAGAYDAQAIRDLLRTVEIIGVAIAGTIALGIWISSGWLASSWVSPEKLQQKEVAHAFALMGIVIALTFVDGIYVSSIAGLQRQVLQNVLTAFVATARAVGAVGVLVWISPNIEAFFLWQVIISVISAALFGSAVYRTLPASPGPARFSWSAMIGVWRFAAGMLGITFMYVFLMQMDKIVLARLLTLEAYGYYTLAWVGANSLFMCSVPIFTAYYPRFTELVTRGDETALRAAYHQASQLVTVVMGAAAIVLLFFAERVLTLWVGAAVALQVAPLLSVLVLGIFLNGVMGIPYYMQLAYGWTSLTFTVYIVAVVALVPVVLFVVPRYGAIGAAWVWAAFNMAYLLFGISFMHRRILLADMWRWLFSDVAIPLAAATATAWLCRWVAPDGLGKLGEFSVLFVSSGLVLTAAALAAPLVRDQIGRHVLGWIKPAPAPIM